MHDTLTSLMMDCVVPLGAFVVSLHVWSRYYRLDKLPGVSIERGQQEMNMTFMHFRQMSGKAIEIHLTMPTLLANLLKKKKLEICSLSWFWVVLHVHILRYFQFMHACRDPGLM